MLGTPIVPPLTKGGVGTLDGPVRYHCPWCCGSKLGLTPMLQNMLYGYILYVSFLLTLILKIYILFSQNAVE